MSPLARVLVILLAVLLVFVAGLGLLWYLAYGVEAAPPERVRLDVLAAPVEIGWGPAGAVTIRAAGEADAWAALGYAHGRQRAWSVVLWRQAALGQLGAWFGEAARTVDLQARQLGLAQQAQASYARLSDEERRLLTAYAAGLQAALAETPQRLRQEFVLLDVTPDAWEPWHTLAIERLFAWLAVSPPPATQPPPDDATRAFYAADARLRQWLRLHGFENSVAWAVRDSAGTHLFQRHVYGDTALPFFLEVSLHYADSTRFQGASLPGTPFFPAGKTDRHAWALLLGGTASLERAAWDSAGTRRVYEQMRYRDNSEHLAVFWRHPDRLALADPEALPDSAWTLRWAGLGPASDVAAWRGLAAGTPAPFALLDGHGLWIGRDGQWRVLGQPSVDEPLPAGRFVGTTRWAAYAAELLRTQEDGAVPLETWIADAYSIWAAQTAPPLIEAAGFSAVPEDKPRRDALTYLRNWDFGYDRASIAASIFDTWMTHYRDATGRLPEPTAQDTLRTDGRLLAETFGTALAHLTETFGADQSQWRWERVQPARRLFPIWSVDTLRAVGVPATPRYAPIDFPGAGHPSALAWNPSPVQSGLPAPAAWEAWVHTERWEALTLRTPRFDANALLGRYLVSDRLPDPLRLPAPPDAGTTTLVPR